MSYRSLEKSVDGYEARHPCAGLETASCAWAAVDKSAPHMLSMVSTLPEAIQIFRINRVPVMLRTRVIL